MSTPSPTAAAVSLEVAPRPRPPSLVQGIYWIATGVWPLVHRASFEWVTGPKVDFWLVQLIGLFLALMGGVMVMSHLNNRVTPEIAALCAGGAAAVSMVSIIHVARGRIAPIYLADVVVELILLAAWMRWLLARPQLRVVSRASEMPGPAAEPRRV